jgi:hypothetical protein
MKETVELYYSPFWAFKACFRVNFTVAYTIPPGVDD